MTMRVVTFKLPEEELERLDRYCRRVGLSRSEVIRKAIKKLLEQERTNSIVRVDRIRIF